MRAARYILISVLIFLSCVQVSSAKEAYTGYSYDSWGDSVSAPNAYKVKTVLKADDMGTKEFDSPTDMAVWDEELYILDSGNNRIVVVDGKFRVAREITLKDSQGTNQDITGAKGIYVQNGRILIADTDRARVVMADQDGKVLRIFGEPPEGTLPSGITYRPNRILLDNLSNLYVLSEGCYMGALVFENNGEYAGYFGANTVQLSMAQRIKRFWRLFMTNTQKGYTSRYVPIEYQSFDIDKSGFIYTCGLSDASVGTSVDEIKKLNALGKNILLTGTGDELRKKNNYGDQEQQWEGGILIDTKLIDIDVADDGYILALDGQRGRVFVYDQNSNLLTIFGGIGSQKGLFLAPHAVESLGEDILVLDKEGNTLTVFEPSTYGRLIRQAINEQKNGKFESALNTWREALKYNVNSELVNMGIGRMLLQKEEYRKAMDYLKFGQDRAGYSKAFRFYRAEIMTQYFPLLALFFIALLAFAFAKPKLKEVYYRKTGKQPKLKTLYISHTLSHPLNFFEDLFYNGSRGALIGSWIMVALLVLATVVQRQATGFIFNTNKLTDFNIVFVLLRSFGLVFLLTLSNWMVGTLLWGEGSLKQIWESTGYALTPYIISVFITVLLSNVLTSEEGSILSLILSIGILYTVFLLFTAVRVIHRYSVTKALFACLLIVLVSMLILFLCVLVSSLLQQFYVFVVSILNEVTYRM